MTEKRPGIGKDIMSKKGSTGGILIPNFKLFYRARAIKIACLALVAYTCNSNYLGG
jgi:hypothetical protein